MSGDDTAPPLNEPGYRKEAVEALLLLFAATIRAEEASSKSQQYANLRGHVLFRVRESPVVAQLDERDREDFDEMVRVLVLMLESETLRVADLNPDDDSVH